MLWRVRAHRPHPHSLRIDDTSPAALYVVRVLVELQRRASSTIGVQCHFVYVDLPVACALACLVEPR